jgi:hypothetical protein
MAMNKTYNNLVENIYNHKETVYSQGWKLADISDNFEFVCDHTR